MRSPARGESAALVALLFVALAIPARGQGRDTRAPAVTVLSPAPGKLTGRVPWEVRAEDEDGGSGVARVEFLVDGRPIAVDADPTDGFELAWETVYIPDGPRRLTARAEDRAGNRGTSAAVEVTLDHRAVRLERIEVPEDREVGASGSPADRLAPEVRMLSPAPNAQVRGTVALTAWAADEVDGSGLARVEFLVDGTVVGAGTLQGGVYRASWSSTGRDGARRITARAVDRSGKSTVSAPLALVVDNRRPRLETAAGFGARVEPGDINTGQILVSLYFNGTGGQMDPGVAPTVRFTPFRATGAPAPTPVTVTLLTYTGRRYLGLASVGTSVPAGRATLSVQGARDRAGNTMAAANNAATFNVVRVNRWPIPNVAAVHSIWHHYGHPIRWTSGSMSPNYFHEGLDLNAAAGTQVRAVEGGTIRQVHVDGGAASAGYYNMVGVDSAGGRAFRYMHMTIGNNPRTGAAWARGDAINAGELIGTLIAYPGGAMLPHIHFELLNAVGGAAPASPTWTARGDPLRVIRPNTDAARPVVFANFGFRYGEHQSAATTTYFPRPGGGAEPTIHGNVDFVARAADDFGSFNRDMSVQRLSWDLQDRFRRTVIPWTVLENQDDAYFDGAGTYSNQRQGTRARVIYEFSTGHQTTGGSLVTLGNDTVTWYTLTNKDDDDQLETGDANRYFNSNARRGRAWFDLDGVNVDARINREAAFSDAAGYRLRVRADDEQGRTRDRTETFSLDNFVPYVERVTLRQGTGAKARRYAGYWALGGGGQRLTPARAEERNPFWIHGEAKAEIEVVFSELVRNPTLRLAGALGHNQAISLTAAGGEGRRFRGTVTKAQLATHRLDGSPATLRWTARDGAGNRLDSNPATFGRRNASRAFTGHDPGTDIRHRPKVDTRPADKPVPERTRRPP